MLVGRMYGRQREGESNGRRGRRGTYVIMPDMTPWSYPKRNTPNETKILVKYLSHLWVSSISMGRQCHAMGKDWETHKSGLPTKPCRRAASLLLRGITAAMIRPNRETGGRRGVGTSMTNSLVRSSP